MTRTVTLVNRAKRTRVLNLTHAYCEALGHCVCVAHEGGVIQLDPTTKKSGVRAVTSRAPEPLTLLPSERRRGVPRAVLGCPEVRQAVDVTRNVLVIEE